MPKSLFVDPSVVREPGKVTFNDIPVNQYNKTIEEELASGKFTKEDLVRIFRDMTILREFETMLNLIKTQGSYNGIDHTYPGPAHLSTGQEAACVGQAYLLDENDFAFGSHRSHSEILAKALSTINKMSDEQLMKVMEEFLDGKCLRSTQKLGEAKDVKELAIRFILYGTLAEIFAVRPVSTWAWAAPCTHSSCPSAFTPTTQSLAAAAPFPPVLPCTRRSIIRRASASAMLVMLLCPVVLCGKH